MYTCETITIIKIMNASITPKSYLLLLPPSLPHLPAMTGMLSITSDRITIEFYMYGITPHALFFCLASFTHYNYCEIYNVVACINIYFS